MPSKFFELYSLASRNDLIDAFSKCLKIESYSLFYPSTNKVCIWREGNQVRVSLEDFIDLLNAKQQREVSFQMWHSSRGDLFCSCCDECEGSTLMILMDGFKSDERSHFIDFLQRSIKEKVFPNLIGFIVDLNETAAPDEWESFFFRGGRCPKLTPDIVGVASVEIDRFQHQSQKPVITHSGQFTLYSWQDG